MKKKKQKQIVHLPLYLHKQPCGMIVRYACRYMKRPAKAFSSYWRDINCNNCRRTHIYQDVKHNQINKGHIEKKSYVETWDSSANKKDLRRILKKYRNRKGIEL